LAALDRLEKRQLEQQNQIDQLVKASTFPSVINSRLPDPDNMNFEEAFNNFLLSYSQIPQEERTNKIRKLSSSSNLFGEFLEMCALVSNQSISEDITLLGDIHVADSSQSWENLYSEIFSSPDVSPGMSNF